MSEDDTPTGFEFEPTPTNPDGAIPEEIKEETTAANPLVAVIEDARKSGYDRASADVMTQIIQAREEVIETTRQLFVIFELQYPDWPTAERWIRARLTPI